MIKLKQLILLVVGVCTGLSTVAFADTQSHKNLPPIPSEFVPYGYVEGNLGYASYNWDNFTRDGLGAFAGLGGSPSNSGSIAGGGDLGFMFTPHWGAEVGGYWLGSQSAETTGLLGPAGSANVMSWMLYLAAKFNFNVCDNLDFFAKAGAGVRFLDYSSAGAVSPFTGQHGYWLPVFGLGANYQYAANWALNAQWMYVAGNSNGGRNGAAVANPRQAPAANLFTFGVGYEFAI